MDKPYPQRLDKAPLFEMIVEIRFTSKLPSDAIFGMAYPNLSQYFKSYEALPILNVPVDVRNADLSLSQQPHYKFFNAELPLIFLIGPKVLTIKYEKFTNNGQAEYPGWRANIKGFIEKILKELFSNITPTFEFPGRKPKNVNVRCSIEEDGVSHTVNLSNGAVFENKNTKEKKEGSLIDIDSEVINIQLKTFLESSENILTKMHDLNKDLFYELMKKELVNKYNPIAKKIK